jgi:hypothetical protein
MPCTKFERDPLTGFQDMACSKAEQMRGLTNLQNRLFLCTKFEKHPSSGFGDMARSKVRTDRQKMN